MFISRGLLQYAPTYLSHYENKYNLIKILVLSFDIIYIVPCFGGLDFVNNGG